MKILVFLWRMLLLPMSSIYKRIVVKRIVMCCSKGMLNLSSPITNALSTAKKYNLEQFIISSVTSGVFMTLSQWKTIVKQHIRLYEDK